MVTLVRPFGLSALLSEPMKRACDPRKSLDEPPIIRDEAKETTCTDIGIAAIGCAHSRTALISGSVETPTSETIYGGQIHNG